jgi:hypothetical protein
MLDMPGGIPVISSQLAETAERCPGCCVKTREKEKLGELSRRLDLRADYGRLLEYGDTVVVVCFNDRKMFKPKEGLCKWVGTRADYHDMWECD